MTKRPFFGRFKFYFFNGKKLARPCRLPKAGKLRRVEETKYSHPVEGGF
jgi:hypothetical protein